MVRPLIRSGKGEVMVRMSHRFLFVTGLALAGAGIAGAQSITGTILGGVTDESGAALSAATVTLRNLQTGATRTALTDAAGRYRAPGLSLGVYEVKAELTGF